MYMNIKNKYFMDSNALSIEPGPVTKVSDHIQKQAHH